MIFSMNNSPKRNICFADELWQQTICFCILHPLLSGKSWNGNQHHGCCPKRTRLPPKSVFDFWECFVAFSDALKALMQFLCASQNRSVYDSYQIFLGILGDAWPPDKLCEQLVILDINVGMHFVPGSVTQFISDTWNRFLPVLYNSLAGSPSAQLVMAAVSTSTWIFSHAGPQPEYTI